MRAMLCGCGKRLEAADDDELVRETLEHYRWEHGMAVVDGDAIRRIVEEGAYGPEGYAGVRHEDSDEELWFRDLPGRPDVLTHTYEGYGGDAMWPEGFGSR